MKRILYFVTGLLVGAALFGGGAAYAAGVMAERSTNVIYVDGQRVELEAYSIYGSNYLKLRDVGKAVGFNVYWDGAVQIDTASPYTGEAPTASTAPAGDVSGGESADQMTNAEIRQEMIRLINQTRRDNGVSELAVNDALMNAAQACSDRRYTWHHTKEECEAVAAAGYPYGFGTNLTVFTDTSGIAQHAVTNWINSPGHFQTMIDPDCDCIGVGVTQYDGVSYCYMFVGKPNSINPYG